VPGGCKAFALSVFVPWSFASATRRRDQVSRPSVANPSKECLPSRHLQATIKVALTLGGHSHERHGAGRDNRGANLACKRKEGFAAPIVAIAAAPAAMAVISFDQNELREIFDLYGRKVADGEWRD